MTPLGSAPLSLKNGVGEPVVVTVNAPAVPTVNVVLPALVMVGAWLAGPVIVMKVVAWNVLPSDSVRLANRVTEGLLGSVEGAV